MTKEQKELILAAWDYCDNLDKSTEFMFSYMADVAKVPLEKVIDYVYSDASDSDREQWYARQNSKRK